MIDAFQEKEEQFCHEFNDYSCMGETGPFVLSEVCWPCRWAPAVLVCKHRTLRFVCGGSLTSGQLFKDCLKVKLFSYWRFRSFERGHNTDLGIPGPIFSCLDLFE